MKNAVKLYEIFQKTNDRTFTKIINTVLEKYGKPAISEKECIREFSFTPQWKDFFEKRGIVAEDETIVDAVRTAALDIIR